jgi:DNA-binding transcriptional MocR family regulator
MEAATRKPPMAVLKRSEPLPAGLAFVDLAAQQTRIRSRIDAAIARVLNHGQYIMGPEIVSLERQLSAFCGAKHSISCASGTDALLMAMMALEVKPGDAILCPGFTYTATPETIALLGAEPVFVDVDADTFNIDPKGLGAKQRDGLRRRGIGKAGTASSRSTCSGSPPTTTRSRRLLPPTGFGSWRMRRNRSERAPGHATPDSSAG